MTMHTIQTDIPVDKMELFKVFLKANNVEVVLSYYPKRINNFQVNNFIEYSYSDKEEETMEGLTYFKLRYESLEKAFKDYNRTIDTIKADLF